MVPRAVADRAVLSASEPRLGRLADGERLTRSQGALAERDRRVLTPRLGGGEGRERPLDPLTVSVDARPVGRLAVAAPTVPRAAGTGMAGLDAGGPLHGLSSPEGRARPARGAPTTVPSAPKVYAFGAGPGVLAHRRGIDVVGVTLAGIEHRLGVLL